tara:strand:- start:351 stop:1766 length:1416 start_codon:yes stop_codon:yes gene_type:complete
MKIAFDFDGVLHLSVDKPETNGQVHPEWHKINNEKNKLDQKLEPNQIIIDLIKYFHKKNYEIFIISHNKKLKKIQDNFLKRVGLRDIIPDTNIASGQINKCNQIKLFCADILFDDSTNVLKDIKSECPKTILYRVKNKGETNFGNYEIYYDPYKYGIDFDYNECSDMKQKDNIDYEYYLKIGDNTWKHIIPTNYDIVKYCNNKNMENISKIQKSYQEQINLITYNVCWEATSGKKFATFCSNSGKNICRENIINFIKDCKFDFLGIQEGDISFFNDLNSKINFNYKYSKSGPAYSGLFYNQNKFNNIKSVRSEISNGRPWVACKFSSIKTNNEYIIISTHMPHGYTDIENKLKTIIDECNNGGIIIDENTNLIIMGDFNLDIRGINKKPNGIELYAVNRKYNMKTCCSKKLIANNGSHKNDFDHILFNRKNFNHNGCAESLNRSGNLIKSIYKKLPMSDHLAKAATLEIKI